MRLWKCIARRKRLWLQVTALILGTFLAGGASALTVSGAVRQKTRSRVRTVEDLRDAGETFDCVLVLGCKVYPDGRLSDRLADRVQVALDALEAGLSDTLLVSGDHRTDSYDETGAMKAYAVAHGISSERVFEDHDGYSTYESVWRAKNVFGAKKVLIVTQEYHLYRALYLAEKLGLEAYGVAADLRTYAHRFRHGIREVLARCKDVYFGLKQPLPEVSGGNWDLHGNGDDTVEHR